MNLDSSKGKTNTLLRLALLALVGFFVFSLVYLNVRQVELNRQQIQTSNETKDLICDIILSLREPTDGQKRACEGLGTR